MAASLQQQARLRARLEHRAGELRDEIRTVEDERADDAGPVQDTVEDAGEQAEHKSRDAVRNAEEDRDAGELRDIEAALSLLDAGTYGECIDCGVEIPEARLDAQPTALRCIDCQSRFEHQHPAGLKASPMT